MKKLAFTFGLNRVDQHAPDYLGWDGALHGCCNDAGAMVLAAGRAGFSATGYMADYYGEMTAYGSVMPDYKLVGDANREAFRDVFSLIAAAAPGDLFFLWYSGHGSQTVYTLTTYEGLCLFDGILDDRELWKLFRAIPAGVRLFIGFDACHAGGFAGTRERSGVYNRVKSCPVRFRGCGTPEALEKGGVNGDIAVWAGCGKNQLSLDGSQNGRFTATALAELHVEMTWLEWADSVAWRMPQDQKPELQLYGPGGASVWNVKVFT